ncbi:S-Ena type endospore appendage, partial [Bacillus cereus]
MNKVICCTPSAIIKDKICIPWSITGGEMGIQTIYTNNLLNHISSTGY